MFTTAAGWGRVLIMGKIRVLKQISDLTPLREIDRGHLSMLRMISQTMYNSTVEIPSYSNYHLNLNCKSHDIPIFKIGLKKEKTC